MKPLIDNILHERILCASFLGYDHLICNDGYCEIYKLKGNVMTHCQQLPHYEKDWRCLHKLIDRIENLTFYYDSPKLIEEYGEEFSFDVIVRYGYCTIVDENECRPSLISERGIDGNTKEAVWKAIIAFIKWYIKLHK